MPTFITLLPMNNVWEIVKNGQKLTFSNFQVKTVTLTFGEGHPMTHQFKGLLLSYLLATSRNSTVNSVWNIIKNCQKRAFLQISSNCCDLDWSSSHPRSRNFKDLPTGHLWVMSHNSTVNSVWDIVNVKVCHTQTDNQIDRQTDRRRRVIT